MAEHGDAHPTNCFRFNIRIDILARISRKPNFSILEPALRENTTLTSLHMDCHGDSGDGMLDARHRLAGARRTQYLGSRGAESVPPDRVFADSFE
jgi:hypothetical protein